jgi:hypothetical protein
MPCVIPGGQSAAGARVTSRQRASPAEPCYRLPLGWFLKEFSFTCAAHCSIGLTQNTSSKLHPFATTGDFGAASLVRTLLQEGTSNVIAVFSSTRLPGFSGRDLLTTTGSSATSHRVGCFLSCLLKSPTDPIRRGRWPDDARLPQLLYWLPVDDYVLNHLLSLSMNWAS